MSYSGEAADQVVRLSLNGVEVAAKLSGSAAKQLAIMIYAILKDQKKTKGKIRLTNMLRSGKELKVFAVKDTQHDRQLRRNHLSWDVSSFFSFIAAIPYRAMSMALIISRKASSSTNSRSAISKRVTPLRSVHKPTAARYRA